MNTNLDEITSGYLMYKFHSNCLLYNYYHKYVGLENAFCSLCSRHVLTWVMNQIKYVFICLGAVMGSELLCSSEWCSMNDCMLLQVLPKVFGQLLDRIHVRLHLKNLMQFMFCRLDKHFWIGHRIIFDEGDTWGHLQYQLTGFVSVSFLSTSAEVYSL